MVMEGAAGRSARSAVVVGGGVGGLSTAIRLKLSGQFDRVRILEKNDRLGGRVKTLKLEESSTSSSSVYRFDTGPSLLLFPEEYMRTFEELGCELPEMKPVGSVGYRCFFNRGGPRRPGQGSSATRRGEGHPPDTLDLLLEDDEMAAQLESVEEGAGEAYSRMIRAARTALEVGNGAFIDRNFATLAEFVNPLRFLPLLPRLVDGGILNPLSLLRPLDGWLRGYFRDPRIRALVSEVPHVCREKCADRGRSSRSRPCTSASLPTPPRRPSRCWPPQNSRTESTTPRVALAKLRWHWRRGPNRLGWRSSWRRRLRR